MGVQIEQATILIVDDQPEILNVLYSILHAAGFAVRVSQSGEDALSQSVLTPPDLILLDVHLTEINGFETCRRLKANSATNAIPVIFLTALTDLADKIQGFEAGGVDYLTKPFQPAELLARVKTHLLLRQCQQQLQEQHLQLTEQHLRFHTLAEATLEGIVMHAQGIITDVNPAFETMFGGQRDDIIGRHLGDYVAPVFRETARQRILTNDDAPYEIEMLRNTGDCFPVVVHAKTMMARGQQVRIAALRDISWRRALEQENARLEEENRQLKLASQDRYKFGAMIGKSPAMQAIYHLIVKAATNDANLVIYGETGVGKELIARTIHQLSDRRDHEFVAVNCGAISENLFEREFFGHRKGAFTGAFQDTRGYFDHAHRGTLFLDEVGELSPIFQVKLLRAIEHGEYLPVGSHTPKTADVRIIAATNQHLETQLSDGRMRSDFFFRLAVMTIQVPPLRERKEDLLLLIEHFLMQLSRGHPKPFLPVQTFQRLYQHDWPGNVRELQNVLQRYIAFNHLEFPGSNYPPPRIIPLSKGIHAALLEEL